MNKYSLLLLIICSIGSISKACDDPVLEAERANRPNPIFSLYFQNKALRNKVQSIHSQGFSVQQYERQEVEKKRKQAFDELVSHLGLTGDQIEVIQNTVSDVKNFFHKSIQEMPVESTGKYPLIGDMNEAYWDEYVQYRMNTIATQMRFNTSNLYMQLYSGTRMSSIHRGDLGSNAHGSFIGIPSLDSCKLEMVQKAWGTHFKSPMEVLRSEKYNVRALASLDNMLRHEIAHIKHGHGLVSGPLKRLWYYREFELYDTPPSMKSFPVAQLSKAEEWQADIEAATHSLKAAQDAICDYCDWNNPERLHRVGSGYYNDNDTYSSHPRMIDRCAEAQRIQRMLEIEQELYKQKEEAQS